MVLVRLALLDGLVQVLLKGITAWYPAAWWADGLSVCQSTTLGWTLLF